MREAPKVVLLQRSIFQPYLQPLPHSGQGQPNWYQDRIYTGFRVSRKEVASQVFSIYGHKRHKNETQLMGGIPYTTKTREDRNKGSAGQEPVRQDEDPARGRSTRAPPAGTRPARSVRAACASRAATWRRSPANSARRLSAVRSALTATSARTTRTTSIPRRSPYRSTLGLGRSEGAMEAKLAEFCLIRRALSCH